MPMISTENLWERFLLLEDRSTSLKETVSRFRLSRGRKDFWALSEISMAIEPGETVGLIGLNGSGKSTLLKCIAGIYPPTKGRVLVGGTVATLIELGADMHEELTGRENLGLNGVLFGLKRAELQAKLDSIVEFAELERFIDQPVRTYSSGMYVRLAFSLAIHVEPDILLIDEVLAVGDEAFQRKCIDRVGRLQERGATIVLVSHDMSLVEELCPRTLLLDGGRLLMDGDTARVVEAYIELDRR